MARERHPVTRKPLRWLAALVAAGLVATTVIMVTQRFTQHTPQRVNGDGTRIERVAYFGQWSIYARRYSIGTTRRGARGSTTAARSSPATPHGR